MLGNLHVRFGIGVGVQLPGLHHRKRWTGKALAEWRRRAMQFHLAGFAQEDIADKLGVDRSVVSRDLAVRPRRMAQRGFPRS